MPPKIVSKLNFRKACRNVNFDILKVSEILVKRDRVKTMTLMN